MRNARVLATMGGALLLAATTPAACSLITLPKLHDPPDAAANDAFDASIDDALDAANACTPLAPHVTCSVVMSTDAHLRGVLFWASRDLVVVTAESGDGSLFAYDPSSGTTTTLLSDAGRVYRVAGTSGAEAGLYYASPDAGIFRMNVASDFDASSQLVVGNGPISFDGGAGGDGGDAGEIRAVFGVEVKTFGPKDHVYFSSNLNQVREVFRVDTPQTKPPEVVLRTVVQDGGTAQQGRDVVVARDDGKGDADVWLTLGLPSSVGAGSIESNHFDASIPGAALLALDDVDVTTPYIIYFAAPAASGTDTAIYAWRADQASPPSTPVAIVGHEGAVANDLLFDNDHRTLYVLSQNGAAQGFLDMITPSASGAYPTTALVQLDHEQVQRMASATLAGGKQVVFVSTDGGRLYQVTLN